MSTCEIIKRTYLEKIQNHKLLAVANRINTLRCMISYVMHSMNAKNLNDYNKNRHEEVLKMLEIISKLRKKEEDLVFTYRVNTDFYEQDVPF